jgi:putative ABC transport system permease protein
VVTGFMSRLQIRPILSALKRHKAGTILIVLQIALTFAVICNAFFIVEQRIDRMSRPTGMVESNMLTLQYRWAGVDAGRIPALTRADLRALRELPGVEDATQAGSYPLSGHSSTEGIRIDPDAKARIALAAEYFTDDHALATMGARLIAGRNFRKDEVTFLDPSRITSPAQVIITKALADKVYPDGLALGKPIYVGNSHPSPSTVIGIVERLQAPSPTASFSNDAILVPQLLSETTGNYLVRSKPGQLETLFREAPAALIKLDNMRVFPVGEGIRTFEAVRAQAYKVDRGMALLMTAICGLLLVTTAAGIVGLSSFWVSQRHQQIGMRRALGATRRDILSYFLTENLLIASGGIGLGIVLALSLNLWMVVHFEMHALPVKYVVLGVIVILALGQGAVLTPAMRASRTSPIEAIRHSRS